LEGEDESLLVPVVSNADHRPYRLPYGCDSLTKQFSQVLVFHSIHTSHAS
jgi:hypothetical protein